ncbi:MAG: RtcB family protein [Candidatus Omnitrophota bacterium]|nr:RtcB family protein [Candidatus Omnitrophota bacterium]MBU1929771.1 RtcB family protein [Candidatus Omnitrophota bacterium]MBU2035227.1 RtcB family protein [Candidatus Omnitrophota bacterium]MBU2258788.1 RtcB family protein [Candidatus Omnitrophota bacterium]
MSDPWEGKLEKIDDFRWRIPKSYKPGMRVPGMVYADEKLLKDIKKDKALEQIANVAFLPGIVNASLAMPDCHWGYGFPIGGVAATDIEEGGVISPGGVGFDINCGVRMLKTDLTYEDINDKIEKLVYGLFSDVPSGIGSKGDIRVSVKEEREILLKGSKWAVEKGYGIADDLECTEEYGAIEGADPQTVSDRAYERGKAQSGTLGSGNHFLEIQVIDQLYNQEACDVLGLDLGQISIMIHSGSRGLGYQICDDYTKSMVHCLNKYGINVPDRQLACAPVNSQEGRAYLSAMKCAANYAWANRQCLMFLTRKVFEKVLGSSWQKMGMFLIYDVAHNIAKIEKHLIGGKEKTLCVHRKGATRAFAPGHPALPERYKKIGQPVIIPGDMGRNSYLLVGTQKAMEETFGSTCHGAGRVKSRTEATRTINVDSLLKELNSKGIIVKASGRGTIAEEAPQAYKNVNDVVDVVHNAGISKRVCRMRPLGVIKG